MEGRGWGLTVDWGRALRGEVAITVRCRYRCVHQRRGVGCGVCRRVVQLWLEAGVYLRLGSVVEGLLSRLRIHVPDMTRPHHIRIEIHRGRMH